MVRPITPDTTVGQLVTERPLRARIFEQFDIDYCCGGKLRLAEACARRGTDPGLVIDKLQQVEDGVSPAAEPAVDPDALTLTGLADHIERTHHAYLRAELPRLDQLTEKVYRVHGAADPRLGNVREAFVALRDELMSHMLKEEQILFPMIRQLEAPLGLPIPAFHCGSIAQPIAKMELEHEHAGAALATMHEATDAYQPPEWACNTYRAMLDSLAQLDRDMHQHVHKENNVLFPKAMELEKELVAKERA